MIQTTRASAVPLGDFRQVPREVLAEVHALCTTDRGLTPAAALQAVHELLAPWLP
jgi:hypothetical protein